MSADDPIKEVIRLLSRMPGIGEKSGSRLAYYILRSKGAYAQDLARSIVEMKERIKSCSECRNLTPEDPCRICAQPDRDKSVVMVVEEPHDLWAVEKTSAYNGLYHVLHGALSALENRGPEDVELGRLLARIERKGIKEVILGTNPSVEGEATANFIAQALSGKGVKVTRIARGIPVGADLEYVDKDSLDFAIKGRREF